MNQLTKLIEQYNAHIEHEDYFYGKVTLEELEELKETIDELAEDLNVNLS
jgi:CTP:phosphocholine cytidylyltransferase-like protein